MNLDKHSLLLYAVTDRSWLKGQTLAQQVEQALLGGATMVQLREKQLDLPHFRREALEIQALCRRYVHFQQTDALPADPGTPCNGILYPDISYKIPQCSPASPYG